MFSNIKRFYRFWVSPSDRKEPTARVVKSEDEDEDEGKEGSEEGAGPEGEGGSAGGVARQAKGLIDKRYLLGGGWDGDRGFLKFFGLMGRG